MKTRFLAIVFAILFALLCLSPFLLKSKHGTVPPSSDSFVEVISKPKKAKKGESFEIQVRISQSYYKEFAYPYGRLEISANKFNIILCDGSKFSDTYTREIINFNDDAYLLGRREGGIYETFRFVYTGEGDCVGGISFRVSAGNEIGQYDIGDRCGTYYKIRGNKIRFERNLFERVFYIPWIADKGRKIYITSF
ncbi:MAG: hypothetical protein J6K14_08875 [Clostridia bacterium]|nr:hypothetical protein [Clostridia bacterium]